MKFPSPLIPGKILRRYKRFLADVQLPSGEVLVVHTPNTGSMASCWQQGWDVMLSRSANVERKYPHTLEMTHNGSTWIGVNTHLPNSLVEESLRLGQIPELLDFPLIKREVKMGESRVDFLLKDSLGEKECLVEVKNVTLRGEGGHCLFPDAVSERGTKHLRLLTSKVREGKKAVIFYAVQRGDVQSFSPAAHIDPTYAKALREAHAEGVLVLVYQYNVSPEGIDLGRRLPYLL